MTAMGRFLTVLLLGAAVFVAGCAGRVGEGDEPAWLLTSATETASERHLIVTVALNDPDALERAARRLEAEYRVKLVAEWPLKAIEVHCFVLRADEAADLETLERALSQADGVRSVQRMRQFSLLGVGYSDEFLRLQTSLVAINALKVHRFTTGMNVRVGVVDTGIDASHPDLAAQVVAVRDFVADRSAGGSAERSGELHGTAIAGVIAADAANGTGIVGVAPDARLLSLRGCWQEDGAGRCSSFSLARAINFAVVKEVDILNLSLAGPYDPLLAELIEAALARGVAVIAAEGESGGHDFPASLNGVIAAGASGAGAIWTQDGSRPLPAPAVDVITTAAGGGYDFFSGSSVAAAHVSGVAALLLQREPSLTPSELAAALRRSVRNEPRERGGPILDSCRAIFSVRNGDVPGRC